MKNRFFNKKHSLSYFVFFSGIFFLFFFAVSLAADSSRQTAGFIQQDDQAAPLIKIGVLAKRGAEQARNKWNPTASYLQNQIPQFSFEILPLDFSEVRQSLARKEIDFLITNSGYYVDLETEFGISRIATLKNRLNSFNTNVFGGVIFTRADRKDITCLHDLEGKDFFAVDPDSFGGWQMAWREFHKHKINPSRDFHLLQFAGTHDEVVQAVLSGKGDAGTVRTDTLERMAQEGKIDLSLVKVLQSRTDPASFPFLLSTELYPEWPFAKMKHCPDELAARVAIALLSMETESEAARGANIAGWTVPLDYQPVHELMQELHIGPYARHPGRVTFADIYREHTYGVLLSSLLFFLLLVASTIMLRLNRNLTAARTDLAGKLQKLKLSEAALRTSEQNYREIFNATNEAFFVHDLTSGAILDVNQAMCDMYGYQKEEARKLSVGDLSVNTTPYSNEEAAQWIEKSIKEGPQIFEWRARKKNGELFWAEVNLKRASIASEDRILAVVHDISRRKETEHELEQYQEQLEKLVEDRTQALRETNRELYRQEQCLAEAQRIAQLGSWDWKIQSNDLWWSEEVYRIFGLSPRDFDENYDSFLQMVHPEDRPQVEKAVNSALQTKKPYSIEHRVARPDGEIRIVHERGEAFFDDQGNPVRMVGTVLDITEKKQAEKEKEKLEAQLIQAQKMEAVGTLAGGIAHDFNNLLTAIIGYAELSQLEIRDRQIVESNLSEIFKAGMRARSLVSQILTFSRRDKVLIQPVRVSSIIKETLKLLRAILPATIEFKQNILSDSGRIMADPTRLHQVMMNLCTNASHAMGDIPGTLAVSLTEEELPDPSPIQPLEPGSYLKLSVSDTGHGIDEEIQDRIFEPFFTTKEKGHGTGMGLSVVHGIVKGCGGEIFLTSEKNKGTTFDLYFPQILTAPQRDEVVATSALPKGNERILLVDDEKQLAALGGQLLKLLDYKVVTMTSSLEALELFRTDPGAFDLVITDQTMPKMTGLELGEEIVKIRPDIPIILCTGYSSMVDENSARQKGIKGFFLKPYVAYTIAKKIRDILDHDR